MMGEKKAEVLERGRFEPLRTGKTVKQRLRKKRGDIERRHNRRKPEEDGGSVRAKALDEA